jgi:hypothetical protein
MKLLHAAAAVLFVIATAGCANKALTPVPMVPYGAPAGESATPWMTAAGCDRDIASRHGKSC